MATRRALLGGVGGAASGILDVLMRNQREEEREKEREQRAQLTLASLAQHFRNVPNGGEILGRIAQSLGIEDFSGIEEAMQPSSAETASPFLESISSATSPLQIPSEENLETQLLGRGTNAREVLGTLPLQQGIPSPDLSAPFTEDTSLTRSAPIENLMDVRGQQLGRIEAEEERLTGLAGERAFASNLQGGLGAGQAAAQTDEMFGDQMFERDLSRELRERGAMVEAGFDDTPEQAAQRSLGNQLAAIRAQSEAFPRQPRNPFTLPMLDEGGQPATGLFPPGSDPTDPTVQPRMFPRPGAGTDPIQEAVADIIRSQAGVAPEVGGGMDPGAFQGAPPTDPAQLSEEILGMLGPDTPPEELAEIQSMSPPELQQLWQTLRAMRASTP